MIKRKGTKFIKAFPKAEPIVAMCTFKDKVFLATTRGVYSIKNEKVEPIKMRYVK